MGIIFIYREAELKKEITKSSIFIGIDFNLHVMKLWRSLLMHSGPHLGLAVTSMPITIPNFNTA